MVPIGNTELLKIQLHSAEVLLNLYSSAPFDNEIRLTFLYNSALILQVDFWNITENIYI